MLVGMSGGAEARTVSGLRRMRVNRCSTCSRGDDGLPDIVKKSVSAFVRYL